MSKPAGYPRISVIICTLNEEMNLPHVLPKIPPWVDEVILVDGHSTDNTISRARELLPAIRVLSQPDKGKGNAMRYGIQQATGEIVVMLDADGSTDPADIPRFVDPLIEGYDFAKGSRFLEGRPVMPRLRYVGNKMFASLANLLFCTRYTDMCAGLNAFWRRILPHLDPSCSSFMDEPTLFVRLKKRGLKVKEVHQLDRGRICGRPNERSFSQGWRILRTIVSERFSG
ncbi:MAG: glycosyltransferase family 2 protein [Dehalococcoidia bacterium]|nr:glycosyltransferase family 2 protein [Dehalococcoidia bacterium]